MSTTTHAPPAITRGRMRAAGAAIVLFTLASDALKGDAPDPMGPAERIVAHLAERQDAVLLYHLPRAVALAVVLGIAALFAEHVAPRGPLRSLLMAAAILIVAVTALELLFTMMAAFALSDGDPATVKAFWQTRFVAASSTNLPWALFAAVAGVAAWPAHRRYAIFCALCTAGFLVGGACTLRAGFFSVFEAWGAFLMFWLGPILMCVTGSVVARRAQSVRAAAARGPAVSSAAA
jgi:hypothetical protein